MAELVAEKPMVKRNDVSIKLDAEVARKARIVAEFEGKPFAAYLSDLLGPLIDRELEKHAGRFLAEREKPDRPKGKKT